jgi:hypothetical protein
MRMDAIIKYSAKRKKLNWPGLFWAIAIHREDIASAIFRQMALKKFAQKVTIFGILPAPIGLSMIFVSAIDSPLDGFMRGSAIESSDDSILTNGLRKFDTCYSK